MHDGCRQNYDKSMKFVIGDQSAQSYRNSEESLNMSKYKFSLITEYYSRLSHGLAQLLKVSLTMLKIVTNSNGSRLNDHKTAFPPILGHN